MGWFLSVEGPLRVVLIFLLALLFLIVGNGIRRASAAKGTGSLDVSPIALEFAGTGTKARSLVESWGLEAKERVVAGLWLDFGLIVIYVPLLILLLGAASNGLRPASAELAMASQSLAGVVVIAGVMDVIENVSLLFLVKGEFATAWAVLAAVAAAGKWFLLLIACVYSLFGLGVLAATWVPRWLLACLRIA